jgi:hypothetical protein
MNEAPNLVQLTGTKIKWLQERFKRGHQNRAMLQFEQFIPQSPHAVMQSKIAP